MTNSIDIHSRTASWTESSGEARRELPDMRLMAGVSVPDSPLITDVLAYARTLYEPYLFNHAVRSWLFAARIGQLKGTDCDPEVVAVGTILHDIGLAAGVSGSNRFEVNGAAAALSFVEERGVSNRRAQLIWDLVALNSTPSIALHKEAEVAVGTMGIALDYGGFGFELIPSAEMTEILNAFPRLKMKSKFAKTCCRLVAARPETSSDNFLRDFGERFVPGYKPTSTVDLLMNAPFEE
jgi:HD domain